MPSYRLLEELQKIFDDPVLVEKVFTGNSLICFPNIKIYYNRRLIENNTMIVIFDVYDRGHDDPVKWNVGLVLQDDGSVRIYEFVQK